MNQNENMTLNQIVTALSIAFVFVMFATVSIIAMTKMAHATEMQPPLKPANVITGKVIRVSDGDTLTVRTNDNKNVTIRLARIDAPEISHYGKPAQLFGKESGAWLREMVNGENVSIQIDTTDRYGRSVGTVKMGKDNINAIMVEDGYAWVYDQYANDVQGAALNQLEQIAREKKKGLWQDANPVNPADFRKSIK